MLDHYLAVDVGSGSVRAGVFDSAGRCLAHAAHPVERFRPAPGYAEQSSRDIWGACIRAVRAALTASQVPARSVRAIGFDATCSLVAIDSDGQPVSVSPTNKDEHDVIMWMDHRATSEALEIEQTGHDALRYIGGHVSPELQIPKVLWLSRHRPDQYARAAAYLDLTDYMVARATGELTSGLRLGTSMCTQVCKWLYMAHESRWPDDLFAQIRLASLMEKPRMNGRVSDPGTPAGMLSNDAARDFGLTGNVTVATGLIDAHAGALGMLASEDKDALVVIGGTSTCHIAVSREPHFVPGVWGPYWGAVLPGCWANEGGQSATGALIEHVIRDSAAFNELVRCALERGVSHIDMLNEQLDVLERQSKVVSLTRDVHVLDYHHGNRSPLADPTMTGTVTGLTLSETIEDLAVRYLATIQAISYGTRHIVATLAEHGRNVSRLRVCGGMTKNGRWLRETADAVGLCVECSKESEVVLLGCAMLAATACGGYRNLREAAAFMGHLGAVIEPAVGKREFHDAKYRVYRDMQANQLRYRNMMSES